MNHELTSIFIRIILYLFHLQDNIIFGVMYRSEFDYYDLKMKNVMKTYSYFNTRLIVEI